MSSGLKKLELLDKQIKMQGIYIQALEEVKGFLLTWDNSKIFNKKEFTRMEQEITNLSNMPKEVVVGVRDTNGYMTLFIDADGLRNLPYFGNADSKDGLAYVIHGKHYGYRRECIKNTCNHLQVKYTEGGDRRKCKLNIEKTCKEIDSMILKIKKEIEQDKNLRPTLETLTKQFNEVFTQINKFNDMMKTTLEIEKSKEGFSRNSEYLRHLVIEIR